MSQFSQFGAPHYISPIDVDERIGRALVKSIFLKFGSLDAGSYENVPALRAAESRTLADVERIGTSLAYVRDIAHTYAWSPSENRPDNGVTVLLPDDRSPDSHGRWLAAPFRDWRGAYYFHGLEVVGLVDQAVPVEAKPNQPSLVTLAKGKTPAVFVSFTGKTDRTVMDQEPGSIVMATVNFLVRVISKNWRGSTAARYGSEIPEEEALDPGASKIIGYIEWLLRGSQGLFGEVPGGGYGGALNLSTSPWTDFCRVIIGNHQAAASFGNDQRLMDKLEISVRVATDRPNEIQDLQGLDAFSVQNQQPQDDGSVVDIAQPYILFARKT